MSGDDGDAEIPAKAGQQAHVAELYAAVRSRLCRCVRLRMDERLHGRFDPSDVVQEAYLDVQRRYAEYVADPAVPVYVWMRFLTTQRLAVMQRQHLGAQMRSVTQEVPLNGWAGPAASTDSLAEHLLAVSAGVSREAMRAELRDRLHAALDGLDPIDREVLTLRHFEELSNNETAAVLGISITAASNRYIRALGRLKDVLGELVVSESQSGAP